MNPVPAERLTTEERRDEVCRLLSLGLLRLRRRTGDTSTDRAADGASRLHNQPIQSGTGGRHTKGGSR